MSEKLTIEGFAGLGKLSVELRKINILIGPQATGKSIVAKLLYFFKSLELNVILRSLNGGEKTAVADSALAVFARYFPPATWSNAGFSIRYEGPAGRYRVSRQRKGTKPGKPTISIPKKMRDQLSSATEVFGAQAERAKNLDDLPPEERRASLAAILDFLANGRVSGLWPDDIFIPAGRSFFAYLERRVFTVLSAEAAIDPFLAKFGSFYEACREHTLSQTRRPRGSGSMDDTAAQILSARYVRERGEDFLEFADGRKVDLPHCSSGQQEALPLAVALPAVPYLFSFPSGRTLYIEEPEAHLFPVTQRHVVELLAMAFNAKPDKLQFVITTHSPYILTAFNNLLQAGRLAKDLAKRPSRLKRLYKVVPKGQILSADDVAAYYLDGKTAEPIVDREEGLIDADVIDSVSEELAIQFDEILEVGG